MQAVTKPFAPKNSEKFCPKFRYILEKCYFQNKYKK